MEDIVNKVAASGIITIDLEEMVDPAERVLFDLKPHLYMELVLREKEFRQFVKEHNWSAYQGKIVGIVCTADAIIPTWAFMLVSLALAPVAKKVYFGNLDAVEGFLFEEKLAALNTEDFRDARVVVKGCSNKPVPTDAFVRLAARLQPVVKSLMYGEPCSTVPLYKSRS